MPTLIDRLRTETRDIRSKKAFIQVLRDVLKDHPQMEGVIVGISQAGVRSKGQMLAFVEECLAEGEPELSPLERLVQRLRHDEAEPFEKSFIRDTINAEIQGLKSQDELLDFLRDGFGEELLGEVVIDNVFHGAELVHSPFELGRAIVDEWIRMIEAGELGDLLF
jgi:hypothetical protein